MDAAPVSVIAAAAAVTIVFVVALFLGRGISGKLGTMEVKLSPLDTMAVKIDNVEQATNHRAAGGLTLSEEVADIAGMVRALRVAVMDLHGQNVDRLEQLAAISQTHTEQIATIHDDIAALTATVASLKATP